MRNPIGEAAVEYYRTGVDKSQRFGQFYINRYMPSSTVWPELFYEEDSEKAVRMILGLPVENGSQP